MTKHATSEAEASALATIESPGILDIEPGRARANLKAIRAFQAVVQELLHDGLDYGTIPGTPRPTLYKPGAEKITKLLNLFEEYEFVERLEDWDRPLFHYVVRCTLRDIATGARVSSGLGECNSRESKFRYRWIAEALLSPADRIGALKRGGKMILFEPRFAIDKKETAGKYGKPPEHWQAFENAIAAGTARDITRTTKAGQPLRGWEIEVDTTLYRVENPEIFDLVNTIIKMGKKRAHVDATLSAGRLSEIFTQDLEDLAEGPPIQQPYQPPPPPAPKPQDAKPQGAKPPDSKPPAPKPLARVEDEWDPGDDPGPEPPDAEERPAGKPELAQLERFAKAKLALAEKGIDELTLWQGIHKYAETEFKRFVTDLQEFSPAEMTGVLDYLAAWFRSLNKTKKEKKA